MEKWQTLSREWLEPTGSLKTDFFVFNGVIISILVQTYVPVSKGITIYSNIIPTDRYNPNFTTNHTIYISDKSNTKFNWNKWNKAQITVPNISKSTLQDKNWCIFFVDLDIVGLRISNWTRKEIINQKRVRILILKCIFCISRCICCDNSNTNSVYYTFGWDRLRCGTTQSNMSPIQGRRRQFVLEVFFYDTTSSTNQ